MSLEVWNQWVPSLTRTVTNCFALRRPLNSLTQAEWSSVVVLNLRPCLWLLAPWEICIQLWLNDMKISNLFCLALSCFPQIRIKWFYVFSSWSCLSWSTSHAPDWIGKECLRKNMDWNFSIQSVNCSRERFVMQGIWSDCREYLQTPKKSSQCRLANLKSSPASFTKSLLQTTRAKFTLCAVCCIMDTREILEYEGRKPKSLIY